MTPARTATAMTSSSGGWPRPWKAGFPGWKRISGATPTMTATRSGRSIPPSWRTAAPSGWVRSGCWNGPSTWLSPRSRSRRPGASSTPGHSWWWAPAAGLPWWKPIRGRGDEVYCTNAVTEIVLEDDAELDHYRLLREGGGAFHLGTVQVHQARNSRYRSLSVASGGSMTRVEINVLLDGEGADCLLRGLYVAGGTQHVDNRTAIEHARPHGTSRELYKGVLSGRSRAVFNGKIVVRKEAQKTDAQQSNRNLMLSRDAEIDSKPQLEILADDVRCSHGTTIGQLEEDELFYLRSRGLNESVARELLVHGFAGEVLDGIAIEPLREGVENRVLSELGV